MSEILEQENEPKYIEIYIQETGDLSRIVKTFELYQNQYIDYKIDIYVPITLYPSEEGHIAGVKTALMYTKRNGKISTTIGYNAILKEQGVEKYGRTYDVYEQNLPRTYVKYMGEQTLIANIYEIDNTDPTDPQFVEIITSQTCPLVVQLSDYIDNEEEPDPSQLEILAAQVNELYSIKQDKVPVAPETEIAQNTWQTSNSVAGAINNNTAQTETNRQNIATNTGNISTHTTQIGDIQAEQLTQNANIQANTTDINGDGTPQNPGLKQQVADLQDIVGSGEDYIGTYTNTLDPETQFEALSSALTDYVETLRPEVQGGDVVIYIQTVSGGTDKNYKFIYSGSQDAWTYYEIPATEKASNDTYGIVKGSYNPSDTNTKTQVNIVSGEFEDIYVRDNSNTQRHLAEYLNTDNTQVYINRENIQTNTNDISNLKNRTSTLETTTTNIINGITAVGKATSATNDGLDRNIANTYLTQTAGVTKVQLKEYALPRAFNDVSYLTSTGYSDTVPTSASPVYTATSESVGDTELFEAEKTIVNAEFQLGAKNSSVDTIYVSASEICTVQFRLITEVNVDNTWHTASVELSDNVNFTTANEIKKLQFGSTFTQLSDILEVVENDKIRQTLEVVTNTSQSITFNVYSNETYPSTFYLNTTSQTIQVAQGDLGEIITLELNGTYGLNDTVAFDVPIEINDSTMAQFVLTLPTVTAPDAITNSTKIALYWRNSQEINLLVVPTLADGRTVPTIKDVSSVLADNKLYFTGTFKLSNGDIYLATSITQGGGSGAFTLIDPPASITLTNDEFELFKTGVVVNGTFLTYINPVFFPAVLNQSVNEWVGLCLINEYRTPANNRFDLRAYKINTSQVISLTSDHAIAYDMYGTGNYLFNKAFPQFQTDLTKNYLLGQNTNGNLEWKDANGLNYFPVLATSDSNFNTAAGTTGVQVDGNLLGLHRPILFNSSGNYSWGYYLGVQKNGNGTDRMKFGIYQRSSQGAYTVVKELLDFFSSTRTADFKIGAINSKNIPSYPSDTTKNYALLQAQTSGDLQWTDWATKQDALSQTQLDAVNSGANTTNIGQIATNTGDISTINGLIPSQATTSNQLADKDFVNSSINALAAYYITKNAAGDPFGTKAELNAATTYYSGGSVRVPTTNDYCLVVSDESKGTQVSGYTSFTTTAQYVGYYVIYNNAGVEVTNDNKDSVGITAGTTIAYENLPTTRYTYQGNQWEYQYTLNATSLTAAQIAAINSGITSTLVTQIGTNTTNIAGKQDTIDSSHKLSADLVEDGNTNKVFTATEQTKLAGLKDITITTTSGSESISDGTNTLNFGTNAFNSTSIPTQASDIGAEPTLPTTTTAGQVLKSTSTAGTVEWGTVAGNVSDVQINGSSILSGGVANIVTNTAYSASTNKIATMTDLGDKMDSYNPTGTGAFSMGRKANTTVGSHSMTSGEENTASGADTLAIGYNNTSSANYSVTLGRNNTANASYAMAVNFSNVASGSASFAQGNATTASGTNSHAEGQGTLASSSNQHALGKYNIEDINSTYVEIVGNGTSSSRSNARTLDWNGNEVLAGGLKINGTDDVITADDVVSTINVTPLANYYTKSEIDSGFAEVDASNLSSANVDTWRSTLKPPILNNYINSDQWRSTVSMSSCSSLQQIVELQLANPYKQLSGGVGALDSNNLKNLLGNPSGFGNYSDVFTTRIEYSGDPIIHLYCEGKFIGKLAEAFIWYDGTNYQWTGWKILK